MGRLERIRKEIAARLQELKAIEALCDADSRQPSETEQARIDELLAEIGESGNNPTGLRKQEVEALRVQQEIERGVANRIDPQFANPPDRVRAIVDLGQRPGRLRAFASDRRESLEAAYRAGRFLMAVLFNREDSHRWCADYGVPIVRGAMGTDSNTLGGFLVPQEFSQAIIDLRETYGVFRQSVRVVPMSSDSMTIPRRLSGVTAYAVGDNDEITASDKSWTQVEVIAKKWGALVKYSSELGEDAFISLADDLASEIAYAFALKEDQAGFIGDGTSTYHGITGVVTKVNDGNHAGSIYTAASGNTAFSTLDLADFEGALGQLPEYAAMSAAWYISRVGYFASMARLLDAAGGNRIADLSAGTGLTFLGLPVRISQVMNATTGAQASTVVAFVGDLNMAAVMGDRRGFQIDSSSDRYFELDQLAIKGTTRFGINVHSLGDASTAGPIVALKTPAS